MVQTSAEALLTIINDILDFSKIEAGKLELDCVPFDLRDSLGETVRALAFARTRKGWSWPATSPPTCRSLVGDPHRLRQVLVNLVGNAIKFTEQGEVASCGLRIPCAATDPQSQSDRTALHGSRHRHRHPGRKAGDDLRAVRAGRRLDDAQIRRHRLGLAISRRWSR